MSDTADVNGFERAVVVNVGNGYVIADMLTGPEVTVPFMGYPPAVGEVCWLYELVPGSYICMGSPSLEGWSGPWEAPWGYPAAPVTPGAVSGVVAVQVLTGCAITFPAVANRYYEVHCTCLNPLSTVAADVAEMTLSDNQGTATYTTARAVVQPTISSILDIVNTVIYSATQSTTITAHGRRVSGTGSLTYGALRIAVTDMGGQAPPQQIS